MTHLMRKVDGGYILSPDAIALMYGAPLSDVLLHLAEAALDGPKRFPDDWVKEFRRRCREAYAATGSLRADDGFRYWAAKYLDYEVDVLVDVKGDPI